jgi:rhodanese-related sulfurtransferase
LNIAKPLHFLGHIVLLPRNLSSFSRNTQTMTEQSTVTLISVAEVKAGLESGKLQVVDVRPSFDFAGGRIPGSTSLPNKSFTTRAEQLDKNRRIAFLSEDGSQGEALARIALSMGFADVANVEGGFDAWLEAGYPVHTIDNGS